MTCRIRSYTDRVQQSALRTRRKHRRSTKLRYHALLEHVIGSIFNPADSILEQPSTYGNDGSVALSERDHNFDNYFIARESPRGFWGSCRRRNNHRGIISVSDTVSTDGHSNSSLHKFLALMGIKAFQRAPVLTRFKFFSKLPPELRLAIWTEAARITSARIVELDVGTPFWQWIDSSSFSPSPRTTQARSINQVCREARIAVTDLHNVHFGLPRPLFRPGYTGSLYFNFDKDILYINTIPSQPRLWRETPMQVFLEAAPSAFVKKVRILAINRVWNYEMIFAALEMFPSLEVLIVVVQHTFPAMVSPSQLLLMDLTVCERSEYQLRLQLTDPSTQRLVRDWLAKKHTIQASSPCWRRKLFFAHTGHYAQAHDCYFSRHSPIFPTGPPHMHLIPRETIKFSDDTRDDAWWRRKKWNGAMQVSDDDQLVWLAPA